MADYAPNFTNRYRVRYRCSTRNHVTTFRWDGLATGTTLADLLEDVGDLFDAAIPALAGDFAVLDASYAAKDSDIFLPAPLPIITVAPASGNPATKGNSPRFFSVAAKTAANNVTRNFLYGVANAVMNETSTIADDYRLLPAENPVAAGLILAYSNIRGLVGPDNNPAANVYNYVNLGLNAYYQRKARA